MTEQVFILIFSLNEFMRAKKIVFAFSFVYCVSKIIFLCLEHDTFIRGYHGYWSNPSAKNGSDQYTRIHIDDSLCRYKQMELGVFMYAIIALALTFMCYTGTAIVILSRRSWFGRVKGQIKGSMVPAGQWEPHRYESQSGPPEMELPLDHFLNYPQIHSISS